MSANETSFQTLSLIPPVLKALEDAGYETPTPIQALTIPPILDGRDIIGQAQTGTGKTAAFALPILSQIDISNSDPQALVLAPTRELALQVAEAFQSYASHLKGFHVLPIYGGQSYHVQLKQLRRAAHVIVGTPGRVIDHIKRGTLKLDNLKFLVLDEADEMLRMGFIEDVEWVISQTPQSRQVALFSATMPAAIRKIAQKYLNSPQELAVKNQSKTADTIRQRFWPVSGYHKLDALTRILEVEDFDGMIVFVRTKVATVELSEKLEARGYNTAPLSGDVPQNQRERTVERLRQGKLDILVATDVAARGLDVERISHVINYDMPYDPEAYVHRIGRTGRAGREGEAILFVTPREKRLLSSIERSTRQRIERMEMPSTEVVNDQRIERFKQKITNALAQEDSAFFTQILEQYEQEHDVPAIEIAGALAKLLQGDEPLLLEEKTKPKRRDGGSGAATHSVGMERFRVEVGKNHRVKPGHIVGAIANETGLANKYIGRISVYDDYSTVDLPVGIPKETFELLRGVKVLDHPMNITSLGKTRDEGNWREGKPKRRRNTRSGPPFKKKRRKDKATV
ncbi:DbpA RNA binding domain family [Synechococcus sp. PCC 7335]|uniref:DEAD/DEAH box helicase n=1 Tax=Synechococcus sp. (strain ATCC 29403 / PCC 7335) TaxID=91464 RepID=UPI00017ECB09|nr:DEAD/DEAH box helicase [Synechococcus sp. PCC 7335]EDX87837.1 DbpA RNA binding domain family [Synechococcus sp. PCC 7335]